MNMSERLEHVHRRQLLAGLAAAGVLALAGCGPKAERRSGERSGSVDSSERPPELPAQAATMTVYRDPGCGCCEAWAEQARQAGYAVTLTDRTDMTAVKRQYGVPEQLASCHTTLVGKYAIEGHVPLAVVARLLKERPGGIIGVAVPGMPRGSPGMEMPDGSEDAFQVIAFDSAGTTTIFSAA